VATITDALSIDTVVRDAQVAVLPIGSCEQHGSHLPLATDTIVAATIADKVADRYGLFCLPPITFSCSHEHEGFAGTVSISAGTLISLVSDIRASLARSNIQQVVMVNGHGGNYVLSNIAQEANTGRTRTVGLFPGRDDMATARTAAGMATTVSEDMHGGEWETSIMLHSHPDLVRATYLDSDHRADTRPYLHLHGLRGYTDSGIIGRPSLATADKGRLAVDSLVESFGALLRAMSDNDSVS
jgi:creatinine amidohydrolase